MRRAPSRPPLSRRSALALALLCAARAAAAQNATVCATNQLDWYTSIVGETPCRTYERLRQICDSRYAVGQFFPDTPGDACDSQLHTCCCNSIAWNLSMLCMNCQNAGNSSAMPNGIDAGVGAEGLYLDGCGVPTNGSLPANIQAGVCAAQIDIRQTLYSGPAWGDGSWFYTYFREAMQSDLSSEKGKNLTNCPATSPSPSALPPSTGALTHSPSTSSATSSSTSPTSSTPPSPPSTNTLNVGAIAGGVAGGVVALLLLLVAAALWWRRRVRRQHFGDAITPAERDRDGLPVLEPFLDAAAPPPYMEDPRKGAPPAPQPTRYPPPPSAYGPSHSGSVAGSGSGSGSAYGSSAAMVPGSGTGTGSGAGSQAGGARTESSRRAGSGRRLSEKRRPPVSP